MEKLPVHRKIYQDNHLNIEDLWDSFSQIFIHFQNLLQNLIKQQDTVYNHQANEMEYGSL